MKQFSLIRIDDRLIHGQIATQWLKYAHGNKVLIIDDKVPEQPMQVRILKAAAPPGIKVIIKSPYLHMKGKNYNYLLVI